MPRFCKECEIVLNYKDGSMNINEIEGIFFCSLECRHAFIERLSDDLHINIPMMDEPEKDIINEMEQEKKASYDTGYEEGYLTGFLESERKRNLCPVCSEREINSVHHILPRKFGGTTNFYNIICLCNVCHDIIETETYELLKKNKFVSTNDLRRYILNGFHILSYKINNKSKNIKLEQR